jgi:hypothetical protein
MSISDQFPRRSSRVVPVAVAPSDDVAAGGTAGRLAEVAAPASWPWRRAALLASVAAQLITISALVREAPVPATWTALLLAIAPAPLALVAAFAARSRTPVPLEYSIEWVTCTFASRRDVSLVSLLGAAQDRLLAHVPGTRPGRPDVPG